MVGINYTPARSGGYARSRDTLELEKFVRDVQDVPYLEGRLIEDQAVAEGNNTLRHNLGRVPRGYWLTKVSGETTSEVLTPVVESGASRYSETDPGATGVYSIGTGVAEGRTVILAIYRADEQDTIVGITDNGTDNTYELVTQVPYNASNSADHLEIWVSYNVTGTPTQWTVDYDSNWGENIIVQIVQVSNIKEQGLQVYPFDESVDNDPITVNTGWRSSGSTSISFLWVAANSVSGQPPDFAETGWTAYLNSGKYAGVGNDGMELFYKIYTAEPTADESASIDKLQSNTAKSCGAIVSWEGAGGVTTEGQPIKVPGLVSSDRDEITLNFDQGATVSLWVF